MQNRKQRERSHRPHRTRIPIRKRNRRTKTIQKAQIAHPPFLSAITALAVRLRSIQAHATHAHALNEKVSPHTTCIHRKDRVRACAFETF